MTQRRYGPTLGAGVTVTELEGSQQIAPGELGYCAYAGLFEKGAVGELNIVRTKAEFNQVMGSYYPGTLAPDACEHFFELAAGAGGLALVRVTDGNEVQAQTTLWTRNSSIRTPMGTLKAKNGGAWGGKEMKINSFVETDLATDMTNTTLQLPPLYATEFATDQLAGGTLEVDEDSTGSNSYRIKGNTSAGLIEVLDEYTMVDDYMGGFGTPTTLDDINFYVTLDNGGKEVSYLVSDGEDNPDEEFSLSVFADGVQVRRWNNLNTDPTSPRYWVSSINDDAFNYYVEAVDLWGGVHDPSVRPANVYSKISTVTANTLTAEVVDGTGVNGNTGVFNSVALGTITAEMVEQTLTCTAVSGGTSYTVVSDVFGEIVGPTGIAIVYSFAGETDPLNKYIPPFTLSTTGAADDDVYVVHYKPLPLGGLVGGYVYPDKVNHKTARYRIADNDHETIYISPGYDMTPDAGSGDSFLVEAPLPMSGGRDGNAGVVDSDFTLQAWDVDTSPFNQLFGKNLGLVKLATPGWDGIPNITSAVDAAGLAYAEAKNYTYRAEIPKAIVAEAEAIAHINDTLGRNDFLVASFPSWGYVADPEAPGESKLKEVPLTGMINGRESRIAADYSGYHKAAAGLTATLPKILKLTTGEALLDEEALNPTGLSVIKKARGNFIIWGDRTCYSDSNWKWKHQREQMSYYEHVLQENYDWVIFSINDPENDSLVLLTLQQFFLPEWQPKRALRGATFKDAAIFKLDAENNTVATRANGDLNVEIQLRLADTVERFNISIGKQGIFESVG